MDKCDIWRAAETPEAEIRERRIAEAADHLAAGRLAILPTETVYGLAADATQRAAVADIFAAKARPRLNPLIAHVSDRDMAEAHGVFGDAAARLAEAFWPGPLTLVVARRPDSPISDIAVAGLDTVALRMPDLEVTRAVIAALGRPAAAPSANRSGCLSATSLDAALAEVGDRVALAVDAGPSPVGVESTVVGCAGGPPVLLRPGGTPRAAIEETLGARLTRPEDGTPPQAPGMLASHYAPAALLRLDADSVAPGEALLAFGPAPAEGWQGARAMLNLSETGDLAEAATNLFGHLRALDASGAATIAAMPVPDTGLGEAINDRLRRAAAPRD